MGDGHLEFGHVLVRSRVREQSVGRCFWHGDSLSLIGESRDRTSEDLADGVVAWALGIILSAEVHPSQPRRLVADIAMAVAIETFHREMSTSSATRSQRRYLGHHC